MVSKPNLPLSYKLEMYESYRYLPLLDDDFIWPLGVEVIIGTPIRGCLDFLTAWLCDSVWRPLEDGFFEVAPVLVE